MATIEYLLITKDLNEKKRLFSFFNDKSKQEIITANSKFDHKITKEYGSLLDLNSKAFSRVFLPKSEKYFQNIKYFACPGIEPTPVKCRTCILPLSQAALIFVCFNSVLVVLLSQHQWLHSFDKKPVFVANRVAVSAC